jgi:hypothetical protein
MAKKSQAKARKVIIKKDEFNIKVNTPLENKVASHNGLAGKIALVGAITAIVCSLFFLSSNLTGNVIGNLDQFSTNWWGGAFFLTGLIGMVIYFELR